MPISFVFSFSLPAASTQRVGTGPPAGPLRQPTCGPPAAHQGHRPLLLPCAATARGRRGRRACTPPWAPGSPAVPHRSRVGPRPHLLTSSYSSRQVGSPPSHALLRAMDMSPTRTRSPGRAGLRVHALLPLLQVIEGVGL